jgi:RNA polymerase sigma factor (sigma-70 family)
MNHVEMLSLPERLRAAFFDARLFHGQLGIDEELFGNRIRSILNKHVGEIQTEAQLDNFFGRFFLKDVYLSEACALGSNAAWSCFYKLYQRFITDLCFYCCPAPDRAEELANKVLTDLFFADRSGRSRIASYDGRVPLSSWLDVVVRHKAIDDADLKINQAEPLDLLGEVVDQRFAWQVYADFRAIVYGGAIHESLQLATQALSDREKLLLLLKYEKQLRSNEIAAMFALSASTITRQLQAISKKLRGLVLENLASGHHLSQAAVDECVEEILENPVYTILPCD